MRTRRGSILSGFFLSSASSSSAFGLETAFPEYSRRMARTDSGCEKPSVSRGLGPADGGRTGRLCAPVRAMARTLNSAKTPIKRARKDFRTILNMYYNSLKGVIEHVAIPVEFFVAVVREL